MRLGRARVVVTIMCRVVQDSFTGMGPLHTDTGSDREGHVDIWLRALLAEGTASIEVPVMLFLDCSRSHVEPEWLERGEQGGQPPEEVRSMHDQILEETDQPRSWKVRRGP